MVGLVMIDFYQLWGFHSRCLRFIILFEICFWVCGQPAPSRDRGACQVLVVTQKGEFSVLQLGIDLLGSISSQSFSLVAKWTLEACCPVSSALNEKEKKKKKEQADRENTKLLLSLLCTLRGGWEKPVLCCGAALAPQFSIRAQSHLERQFGCNCLERGSWLWCLSRRATTG